MTKFNLIKDMLMIALLGFLLYDRINPKAVASEKIVTVIRDTVTTPVIITKPIAVSKPKPAKPQPSAPLAAPSAPVAAPSAPTGLIGLPMPLDTSNWFYPGTYSGYNLYLDTIDIHPGVKLYAEHDAVDLVESRYKADIKMDTTVIIREKPCPRLPYFSFYAFSQMSNTGAAVGAAITGRKVLAGYSYDLIQKSHQVTIGYRLASF